jgi:hypothetical protein
MIFLTVGMAAAANAQTPLVESAEIVEFGIYKIERSGEHIQIPSTASGGVKTATWAHLVTATNRVPAEVGTTFGCHFVVKGEPTNAAVTLEIVVEHPPFEKTAGQKTGTVDKVPWQYVIGQKVGYTYTFDEPWEAVPGDWSIQVWYRQKKLTEQKFLVEKRQ